MNHITKTGMSLALLFLSIITTQAQIRFQKTFGASVLDWSNSIIPTSDSNYVILGSTKNFGAGLQDMLLVKVNIMGDTIWSKALGLSAGDEEGATVQQTNDGGFMITGTTASAGGGGDDYILIKTDANGDAQWSRTYGGPNVDFCSGGKQLFDGGYILAGNSSSFGAGAADMYLVRTDGNGDTLWTHTYGVNTADYAFGIAQTADSGFIVTGSGMNNGSTDLMLLKTTANGDVMWSNAYGGSGTEAGYAVLETVDGYCVAGSTNSFGSGGLDAMLLKTDFTGAITWTQAFGTTDSDAVYSLRPTADGGYIMAGYAKRSSPITDEVLLLKTDGSGAMTWATVMGGPTAGRDVGRSAFESADGSFLLCGFTQSFGGGTEVYLIKTNMVGNAGCNMLNVIINSMSITLISNTTTPTVNSGGVVTSPTILINGAPANLNTLCISTAVEENELPVDVSVYPNPMTDYTSITVTGIANSDLILTISDISGKVIDHYTSTEFNSDKAVFTINRNNLSAGLYIYSVSNENSKPVKSGKLVIQDN